MLKLLNISKNKIFWVIGETWFTGSRTLSMNNLSKYQYAKINKPKKEEKVHLILVNWYFDVLFIERGLLILVKRFCANLYGSKSYEPVYHGSFMTHAPAFRSCSWRVKFNRILNRLSRLGRCFDRNFKMPDYRIFGRWFRLLILDIFKKKIFQNVH